MTNGRVTSNFRRASQGDEAKLDLHAGPCGGGAQHKWGEKENRRAYISRVLYDIPCLHAPCARVQVVAYGSRGNHTAGYYTRSEDA